MIFSQTSTIYYNKKNYFKNPTNCITYKIFVIITNVPICSKFSVVSFQKYNINFFIIIINDDR